MNSVELKYALDTRVTDKDIMSLLIYLANKEYIRIIEKEEKKLTTINYTYEIKKIKNYDGNNQIEKQFMQRLFKNRDTVSSNDLQDIFYQDLEDMRRLICISENKHIYVQSFSIFLKIIISLFSVLSLVIGCLPGILNSYSPMGGGIRLAYPVLSLIVLLCLPNRVNKVAVTILSVLFCIVPFFGIMIPYIANTEAYLPHCIVGSISAFILLLLSKIVIKRTKHGREIAGKILGFRNFIDNVSREELVTMTEQTPSYFFDILPYTYVLKMDKEWIEKFDGINLQRPRWYFGLRTFNVRDFGKFLDETIASISRVPSAGVASSAGSTNNK